MALKLGCFLSLLFVLAQSLLSTEKIYKVRVCENSWAFLNCTSSTAIKISFANYGRQRLGVCNPQKDRSLDICGYSEASETVDQLCTGRTNCSIIVSNETFADNCGEWPKYLEIHYLCADKGVQTTTPLTTTEVTTAFRCPNVVVRHAIWYETVAGFYARALCPNDDQNFAEWFCDSSGWSQDFGPDMSRCTSLMVKHLFRDSHVRTALSLLKVAERLSSISRMKSLYGGDLVAMMKSSDNLILRSLDIIREMRFTKVDQFHTLFSQHIVTAMSNILGNVEVWDDLPPRVQKHMSLELHSQLQNLADKITETMRATTILFPSRNICETEGSAHNLLERDIAVLELSLVRNSTVVLPLSFELFGSDSTEMETAELNFKNIDKIKKITYISYKPQSRFFTPKVIKSDSDGWMSVSNALFVSANASTDGFVTIKFNAPHEQNVTCAWFDESQQSGQWSLSGCSTWTNSTEDATICQCKNSGFVSLLET